MPCLFILLPVSFAEQKFYYLIKSCLSVLSFMYHVFSFVSKILSLNTRSSKFSVMLPPRSFIVLCFTSRSIIHFELIFVKDVRSRSRFIFSASGCLVVLASCVKENIFAPLYCFSSFVKRQLTIFM